MVGSLQNGGHTRMQTHEEVKRELLKDPEVRAEYERLESELRRRRTEIRLARHNGARSGDKSCDS